MISEAVSPANGSLAREALVEDRAEREDVGRRPGVARAPVCSGAM